MTSGILEDVLEAVKRQGIVKKAIPFISTDDVDNMINAEDMPVLGYSLNQTGIDKKGMILGTAEFYVVNISEFDSAMIQATKDTNMTIIRGIYNAIDNFEQCSVDGMTAKGADNDNVLVATMANMTFRY